MTVSAILLSLFLNTPTDPCGIGCVSRSGNLFTGYSYSVEGGESLSEGDITWAFARYPLLDERLKLHQTVWGVQLGISIVGVSASGYYVWKATNSNYRKNMDRVYAIAGTSLILNVALGLFRNYVYGSLGDEYNVLLGQEQ
jgi:hypothetical protein